jgi:hypothetical protein
VESTLVDFRLVYKYYIKGEVTDSDKHYRLLRYGINYIRKKLVLLVPVMIDIIKLYFFVTGSKGNKLERLGHCQFFGLPSICV